ERHVVLEEAHHLGRQDLAEELLALLAVAGPPAAEALVEVGLRPLAGIGSALQELLEGELAAGVEGELLRPGLGVVRGEERGRLRVLLPLADREVVDPEREVELEGVA